MPKPAMNDMLKKRMAATQQASELQVGDDAYAALFRAAPVAAQPVIRNLPVERLRPFFTADIGFKPYLPPASQNLPQMIPHGLPQNKPDAKEWRNIYHDLPDKLRAVPPAPGRGPVRIYRPYAPFPIPCLSSASVDMGARPSAGFDGGRDRPHRHPLRLPRCGEDYAPAHASV